MSEERLKYQKEEYGDIHGHDTFNCQYRFLVMMQSWLTNAKVIQICSYASFLSCIHCLLLEMW